MSSLKLLLSLLLVSSSTFASMPAPTEGCESQCEKEFQQCQKDADSLLLGGFVKRSAKQSCENIKEECLKKCPKKQHVHGKNCKHGHHGH